MKKRIKLLAGATLLGLSTLTLASCKNPIDVIKGWFDDNPVTTTETPTTPEITDGDVIVDGTGVAQGSTVSLGKQVIFKKASARTALTVSATVLPTNANNRALTWSLSWKTATSESVSDYVTITPSADTFKCSITIKKGFNIPINLTAKSVDGVSATCQLDFLKQVENFYFNQCFVDSDDYSIKYQDLGFFSYNISEEEKFYSEHKELDSTMSDACYFWNPAYDSYYTYLDGNSELVHAIHTDIIGTVGTIVYKDLSTYYELNNDCAYDLTLTDEATNAIKNAGYSKYIKDKKSMLCSGDGTYSNLFCELFNTTSMTESDANEILTILKGLGSDIFSIKFEFATELNNMICKTQTATYSAGASIQSYIPTTSIEFDVSNIIVE